MVYESKIAQNLLLASLKEEFLVDAKSDVLPGDPDPESCANGLGGFVNRRLGFPLFSKLIGQRKISRFQD